ncbi:MAG TPA: copper resistance CopC family protein [Longimicrobiales bacterium]|nr:copper resistance CopC family protein [Longimicrobiales bacterium]
MMRARALILAAGLLTALGATAAAEGEAAFHFALSRSAPAADAAVPSPSEVRLWFTQVAQPGSVAIRLINPAGGAVPTGEPTPNEDDGRVYHVSVSQTLPAGAYTVSWRGIGDDGHVVRADFRFTVNAE